MARSPETGSIADAELATLQQQRQALAARVSVRDGFASELRTVAGCRVGELDDGATIQATVVVLAVPTLELLAQHSVRLPSPMPRDAEWHSFRMLPALMEAIAKLSTRPDLALVEGHGIAHPHRLGLASHLGVAADLPTVGVASDLVVGTTSTVLHDMRGAFVPLRDGRVQIGWVLRSKVGSAPLAVSPGHRVALASAAQLAMRFVTTGREPEPIRLAREAFESSEQE